MVLVYVIRIDIVTCTKLHLQIILVVFTNNYTHIFSDKHSTAISCSIMTYMGGGERVFLKNELNVVRGVWASVTKHYMGWVGR